MLIGVVTAALGLAAAGGFGSDVPSSATAVVRQARIVCEPEAARVPSEPVSALRDGVHLVVENASGATMLEIRSPTDALLAELPLSSDTPTEAIFPLPPGPVSVTCVTAGEAGATDIGVITVVDPGGRWVSPDLPCGPDDVERSTYETELVIEERASSTARRAVPGLHGSDLLESPGYPASTWHGDLLVVVRDGETIARIARADDKGMWNVFVDACPGAGLGEV